MNIDNEEFVTGLERSVEGFPSLIKDWPELDQDLQEEYTSQIEWILQKRWDVIAELNAEEASPLRDRLLLRINIAMATMALYEEELLDYTGLRLSPLASVE